MNPIEVVTVVCAMLSIVVNICGLIIYLIAYMRDNRGW